MITPRKPITNPWRLTQAQERVIDAMTRHGCHKLVARELNVSVKTIEAHMHAVRERMQARNQTMAAITYHRWKTGDLVLPIPQHPDEA